MEVVWGQPMPHIMKHQAGSDRDRPGDAIRTRHADMKCCHMTPSFPCLAAGSLAVYQWTPEVVSAILLTCILGTMVTVSGFFAVALTGSLTFSVVGCCMSAKQHVFGVFVLAKCGGQRCHGQVMTSELMLTSDITMEFRCKHVSFAMHTPCCRCLTSRRCASLGLVCSCSMTCSPSSVAWVWQSQSVELLGEWWLQCPVWRLHSAQESST